MSTFTYMMLDDNIYNVAINMLLLEISAV